MAIARALYAGPGAWLDRKGSHVVCLNRVVSPILLFSANRLAGWFRRQPLMLGGARCPILGLLFDQHVALEFQAKDADATMETMVDYPTVIHVPVLTGGRSTDQLHTFYRDSFIPAWPDDTEVEQVSRTVGTERVVDELIMRFTHTVEMPFWLPGVAPTGCKVAAPSGGGHGTRRRQGCFRAHLLGSSVTSCPGWATRFGQPSNNWCDSGARTGGL